MARFFALVTAALAAATVVTGQLSSPVGNTWNLGRGAMVGTDLYFPDTAGHVIIRVTPSTGASTVIAGLKGVSGSAEGNSTDGLARFNAPQGVCTDGTNLFVADTGNNKIRRIALGATAAFQTTTPYGPAAGTTTSGDAFGTASATAAIADARFNGPTDCQFIGTADMYVADASNNKIKKIVLATGAITKLAGPTDQAAGQTDAAALNDNGRFENPTGLCTDGTDLFVADTTNNQVRKITTAGVMTTPMGSAAGKTNPGFVDSTTIANVRFSQPTDCAGTGTAGTITVVDSKNNALRRVTGTASAAVWAGTGSIGDSNADAGVNAQFWSPIGIVGDQSTQAGAPTNVYVSEQYSRVRKVVYGANAGAVTLVAGLRDTSTHFSPYACTQVGTNLYCTDNAKHCVYRVVEGTGLVTVFAGTEGVAGDVAGAAGTGRMNGPTYIASDGTDLFVSDSGNNKLRKIVVATTVLSTPGGFGGPDGTITAGVTKATDNTARWNNPRGIARVGANLYVADSGNNRILSIAHAGGAAATIFAGPAADATTAGDAVGTTNANAFRNPEGVCAVQLTTTDGQAGILVVDSGNNKLKGITISTGGLGFDTTAGTGVYYGGGTTSTTVSGGNSGDVSSADSAATRFNAPRGCAADVESGAAISNFVVIADSGNNKVKKITLHATATSRTMLVLGAADTTITAGNVVSSTANLNRWSTPSGVARRTATSFSVADTGNRELKNYDGTNTVVHGLGGTDAVFPAYAAAATAPVIAPGSTANANTAGSNPWLTGASITATQAITADGRIALFNGVRDAAAFSDDTWYVTDTANHVIRKITYNVTAGTSTVSTFVGIPGTASDVIATAATATFNSPTGIVANGTNQLFVSDSGNNKIKLITIAADGTPTVTIFSGPVAGTITAGDTVGANAAATAFTNPQGLAIWGGDLYVADTGVNKIKKITSAGVSSVFAGGAAGNTDGAVASALFSAPRGLAANGTFLVVADTGNHRIRQCTATTCSTFAGAGAGSTDATGTAALFSSPWGVGFDQFGFLYVADTGNNKIRKATGAGVVTTVVGSGTAGAADQATATSAGVYTTATLNGPHSIFFSRTQPTLGFIGDAGNNKIRAAVGLGTAAVTVTATATATNTTTTTLTNTTTVANTTAPNTTTASTTAPNTTTTVAPTTTRASNAVVAAATAVVVAVLAIFA